VSTARNHMASLAEQITAQTHRLDQLRKRLDNENYVKNAPKEIVRETKQQLAETTASIERLTKEQERFAHLDA